jgi:RNA polymerase sigma factor for flagellar operon FliA
MPVRSHEQVNALVLEHIHLPAQVARAWFPSTACDADREDLIGAAMEGLLDAARRFRKRKGAFAVYARWRIRGAIRDHLRALDPLTREMRDHRNRIGKAFDELVAETARVPSSEEIAARLGISVLELVKLQRKTLRPEFIDLDGPPDPRGGHPPWEVIPDPAASFESAVGARLDVSAAIRCLDDARRHVIEQRFRDERRLKDIGMDLQVTESRACQMVQEALRLMAEEVDAPVRRSPARRTRSRARAPRPAA